jgi:hypothetical protein
MNTEHTTGFLQLALKTTLERGTCNETDFPSDSLTRITKNKGSEIKDTLPLSEAIHDIHLQKNLAIFLFTSHFHT